MPDHVHLALTPLRHKAGEVPLTKILQSIKGASAHRINKYVGRKGKLWQDESFDRAARSFENLWGKIEYMIENPVRAGLVANPADYKWLWVK